MPSSEDKLIDTFQNYASVSHHFEKLLAHLLEKHKRAQKIIATLQKKNKMLKELLDKSQPLLPKNSASATDGINPLKWDKKGQLAAQIDGLIQEINICLTYFEQA